MGTTPNLSRKVEAAVRRKLQEDRRTVRTQLPEARRALRAAEARRRAVEREEEAAWSRHEKGPKWLERWEKANHRLVLATRAQFGCFDRVHRLEAQLEQLYRDELQRRLEARAANEGKFAQLRERSA